MTPTPGLCLEYLPLPDGGARLIRLYGETPCPVLPEAVNGLPLTELGPYCFAPEQRARLLPPPAALCRYTVPAAPRGRYDLGEDVPSDDLPRIAGKFLEQITLPDPLRLIGEAAFYNCRALTAIHMGRGVQALGSDALTNTLALTLLTVRGTASQPSGAQRLLDALRGEVELRFADAVLWYPEFWEDITEVPAHMLIPTFSGRGYQYRQCFAGGAADLKEYDAVLHTTGEGDDPATLAMLAFDRLRYPVTLSPEAEARYRAYLADPAHGVLCAKRLLTAQDTDALRALLSLAVLTADALRQVAELAVRADNAEAAALAAAALRGTARRRRYEF